MIAKPLTLSIVFNFCNLISAVFIQPTENYSELLHCVRKIYTPYRELYTAFYSTISDPTILNYISKHVLYHKSHVLNSFDEKHYEFILILGNGINKMDRNIRRLRMRNPLSKQLFVNLGDGNINDFIKSVMATMVVNDKVVIVGRDGDIYNFAPFVQEKCGKNESQLFVSHCSELHGGIFDNYEGEVEQFSGCKACVELRHTYTSASSINPLAKGLEIKLIKEASKVLNVSFFFEPFTLDFNAKSCIHFGGLQFNENTDFEMTYPYLVDYKVIVVPMAVAIAPCEKFMLTFGIINWLLIIIFGFILLLIYIQHSRILSVMKIHWIIIFYLHSSIFTTSLVRPIYEKQISTIEEMISYGPKLYRHPWLDTTLDMNYPYSIELCSTNCLDNVVNHRNISLLTSRLYAEHLYSSKPFNLIHVRCTLISIRAHPGNPLIRPISRLAQRLSEGGIINKWIGEFETGIVDPNIRMQFESLSLGHLKLPFAFYIFAILMSFLIFVCEMVIACF